MRALQAVREHLGDADSGAKLSFRAEHFITGRSYLVAVDTHPSHEGQMMVKVDHVVFHIPLDGRNPRELATRIFHGVQKGRFTKIEVKDDSYIGIISTMKVGGVEVTRTCDDKGYANARNARDVMRHAKMVLKRLKRDHVIARA